MTSAGLRAEFDAYSKWYLEKYVPALVKDDPEDGLAEVAANRWDRPLRGLRVVDAKDITNLEAKVGDLPSSYRELLTTVGVGLILAAGEDEPAPFRILRPSSLSKARKAALASLSEEDHAKVAKKHGIDASKLLPIIADGEDDDDASFWIVLTRQTATDDRVAILERDHEDGWPFGRKRTVVKALEGFVARWIACAKKREPLDPFQGL